MQSRSGSRGAISYSLQEREGGGWDIVELTVREQSALPVREGEFASASEAEQAALDRAKAFAEGKGWEV